MARMNKKDLSERDICTKYITPAINAAGWAQRQFREEVLLTKGRIVVRGRIATRIEWSAGRASAVVAAWIRPRRIGVNHADVVDVPSFVVVIDVVHRVERERQNNFSARKNIDGNHT